LRKIDLFGYGLSREEFSICQISFTVFLRALEIFIATSKDGCAALFSYLQYCDSPTPPMNCANSFFVIINCCIRIFFKQLVSIYAPPNFSSLIHNYIPYYLAENVMSALLENFLCFFEDGTSLRMIKQANDV